MKDDKIANNLTPTGTGKYKHQPVIPRFFYLYSNEFNNNKIYLTKLTSYLWWQPGYLWDEASPLITPIQNFDSRKLWRTNFESLSPKSFKWWRNFGCNFHFQLSSWFQLKFSILASLYETKYGLWFNYFFPIQSFGSGKLRGTNFASLLPKYWINERKLHCGFHFQLYCLCFYRNSLCCQIEIKLILHYETSIFLNPKFWFSKSGKN
jgi:hypothetical protein